MVLIQETEFLGFVTSALSCALLSALFLIHIYVCFQKSTFLSFNQFLCVFAMIGLNFLYCFIPTVLETNVVGINLTIQLCRIAYTRMLLLFFVFFCFFFVFFLISNNHQKKKKQFQVYARHCLKCAYFGFIHFAGKMLKIQFQTIHLQIMSPEYINLWHFYCPLPHSRVMKQNKQKHFKKHTHK